MKNFACMVAMLVVVFSSCKKNDEAMYATSKFLDKPGQLISTAEINAFIKAQIQQHEKFIWSSASNEMLYSAIVHSGDQMVSIGFKPEDETDIERKLSTINLQSDKWKRAKESVKITNPEWWPVRNVIKANK